MVRNMVIGMLFVTVIAPIVLYTDRLGTFHSYSSCKFPIFFFLLFFFPFLLLFVLFIESGFHFSQLQTNILKMLRLS